MFVKTEISAETLFGIKMRDAVPMEHHELVKCQGTGGSACLPSPLGVQGGKHQIPSPASAALKASIKISALLQEESEE